MPRLYERVAVRLAREIAEGMLPVGTRLTETGLAARLGTSRAPVRQALGELTRRGLLAKADGRGHLVAATDGAAATGGDDGAAPLVVHSTWEDLYHGVEEEIVARIAFAEWRLNEAALARAHEVSRTVARDVVGRLQSRGLLRRDERGRWHAPALTRERVTELYELRALLEPAALTKAAPNLPDGMLAAMRAAIETAMAAPRASGETLDALEGDLHVRLLGHCRQRALMETLALPQALLSAHRFLYRWSARLFAAEPFLPEHLEIVARLEAGRSAAAAEAMRHHLHVSLERAIVRVDFVVATFDPADLPALGWLEPV
ncbi:MAG: GntR family transcriptional regulator [Paracoccaceae bacterium]